jgi:hypothetical protein
LARFFVVNSVGIAQIEAISRTEAPNRMLNKPGKYRREFRIKDARIDQSSVYHLAD